LLIATTTAFFAGCESSGTSARIQEKAAVFGTLTPEQQANIKEGVIDVGYTQDMAYMAFGKPTTKESGTSEQGAWETWVYRKYYGKQGQGSPVLNAPAQHRYMDAVVSSSSATSQGKHAAPSLNSTQGVMSSLNVPDMEPQKLTIYFVNGVVT